MSASRKGNAVRDVRDYHYAIRRVYLYDLVNLRTFSKRGISPSGHKEAQRGKTARSSPDQTSARQPDAVVQCENMRPAVSNSTMCELRLGVRFRYGCSTRLRSLHERGIHGGIPRTARTEHNCAIPRRYSDPLVLPLVP